MPLSKISTDEVKVTQFAPHGRVEIAMEGDVLHYTCTGPFNKELVDCMAVTQAAMLRSLERTGPWASIATFVGSAMCPPDGIQRYTELIQTQHPPGQTPVATAFVVGPEVEGGRIMESYFTEIFASIGRPFAVFSTMAEARDWVQPLLDANRTLPSRNP
ncbi:MAG: hypothetical protein WA174_07435 [Rhodoferax sp.]